MRSRRQLSLSPILLLSALTSQPTPATSLATPRAAESTFNATPYDPGFPIAPVINLARTLPSHSWEFGTAIEALLELYTPSASVFASSSNTVFPPPSLSAANAPALSYARDKIVFGEGADALSPGEGATGDPASLGVGAVLVGAADWTGVAGGSKAGSYWDGAGAEIDYLVNQAPRWSNGALSQRSEGAELWADFMYMTPPFLAYFAASTNNATLLQESVRQCALYRDILQPPTSPGSTGRGLWRHIIGPYSQDTGFWATGNGWAAAGMARVLATAIKAPLGLFPGEATSANRREVETKLDMQPRVVAASHGASGFEYRWTAVTKAAMALGSTSINLALLDAPSSTASSDSEYADWLDDPASSLQTRTALVALLVGFIKEILDAIVDHANLDGGLVRNYVDDVANSDGRGFGDASATALLASVAYRMAVIVPDVFSGPAAEYVAWAEGVRRTLGTARGGQRLHVAANGTITPTVNPLGWADTKPWTAGSPEAQSFVVLMYAAWRDCVDAGVCDL